MKNGDVKEEPVSAKQKFGRKLPGFPNPDGDIERLINELIAAVDKAGLGQFRIHFYEGGLVDVNLNKKPARRRRVVGGRALT